MRSLKFRLVAGILIVLASILSATGWLIFKNQQEQIQELIKLSIEGSFTKANELLQALINQKLPRTDILNQLSLEISSLKMNAKEKIELLNAVAKTDYLITQSKHVDLQLSSLLARIAIISKEHEEY